jgi:cobalt-zinc-cadmium efflux system outer membrane protein
MQRLTLAVLWVVVSFAQPAFAQISLSDDIILAVQNESKKQKAKQSELGRAPGASSPLFGTATDPTPLTLQPPHALPHHEFLRRTSRGPGDELSQKLEREGAGEAKPLRVPQLELPAPLPERDEDLLGGFETTEEDLGPPSGLTLDQAIARLVAANHELRTKFHEIPMAEADVLTAGLRENPLLFYDSSRIPYGSYSAQRPGSVEHGISVVYPIDYSGKRKARVSAAKAVKRVRQAQYQNAVRLEIDNLYSAYIDVLESRDLARRAEQNVRSADLLLEAARGHSDPDEIDDLMIDRETAALRVDDERKRVKRARQILAEMLALPPSEASRLELYGTTRDDAPTPPSIEILIRIALERRPDLVAHRLGVPHAVAEYERAKAEGIPNAYFLFSPLNYSDRMAPGELDSKAWGIGVFLPLPLYDRNQGNIKRSQINISRTQSELATVERQVITEVQASAAEYLGTREDIDRLERLVLPRIQRRRHHARDQFQSGTIDVAEYMRRMRDHESTMRHYRDVLTRHRRSMLDLNTAVGCRILP